MLYFFVPNPVFKIISLKYLFHLTPLFHLMPTYSFIFSDVSTTMILTPGPVVDFLRANQGIQDARRIEWIKVIHEMTPEKPALCFFFFVY